MKKEIVHISPYYEPRMWGGGTRLETEFHYHTDQDVDPNGQFLCIAVKPVRGSRIQL